MTDVKDEDTSISPEQISIAKNEQVNSYFQAAFNARNNIQGLINQRSLIVDRNQALAGEIEKLQRDREIAKAAAAASKRNAEAAELAAHESKHAADTLDADIAEMEKKLNGLKEGLAQADDAIKKLEAAGANTAQMQEMKGRIVAAIAEDEKAIELRKHESENKKQEHEDRKREAEEHHQTAEAHTERVKTSLTDSAAGHDSDVLQQLQQIETQIEFNQQQAEQKQKQAEDTQAMSDEAWWAIPENHAAAKKLLTDAQQRALKEEDDAAAANAKTLTERLVSDAEMKNLELLVDKATIGFTVASKLPDHLEGHISGDESDTKKKALQDAYDAIVKKRTELGQEAAKRDKENEDRKDDQTEESEEDKAARSKDEDAFKEKVGGLRKEISDFKETYEKQAGVMFNFSAMMPSHAEVDELKTIGTKALTALQKVIQKEKMRMASSAINDFTGSRYSTLVSAKPKEFDSTKDITAWEQSVLAFLDKLKPFLDDLKTYKEKVTKLEQEGEKGTLTAAEATSLLSDLAPISARR
jgi:hypothetical protein